MTVEDGGDKLTPVNEVNGVHKDGGTHGSEQPARPTLIYHNEGYKED